MFKGKRSTILVCLLAMVLLGWMSIGKVNRLVSAEAKSQYQDLQLFTDVLSIVRKSYVEEVPLKDLVYGAINGMLSSLDPHSSFMPPEMYKEMKIDTRGEFGGLGIEITVRDGLLTIVSPIEDTPAFRAGLEAGDQILKIEERFTKDMTIMEAVKLMRGPKGTSITITIMRESFDKPREFTLTREIIKIKSVRAHTLEDGFGYLRLVQFQEHTAEDMQKALETIRRENGGRLEGLVLDLRNNPGGLLDQAIEVTDAFIGEGLIVYTEGREEGSRMRFSAHKRETEPDYPMVVLINGGSASASEIVAGALQDHRRAVVMGTASFGKGSVQTIIPLSDDSGLRLTTARYFTPSGRSIQARGIVPDIVVKPVEITETKDGHFREKDLKNHFETPEDLENRSAEPQAEPPGKFSLDPEDKEDYQLMRALDLLKGWQILKGINGHAA
ncbi:peptidase S41 [Desulfuromonas versatilis]|uniref:Peptidase S41 n=1 Tax=Desulfuromonas versatilis TaxID=2802975 RepID=A0ABN6E068_9BACT|nr:peptidase S41 [Desulfuromonas versatilis]